MENKKQVTAVEWLVQQTPNMHWEDGYWADLFEQAKEMEKQQIQDAYRISPNNELWSNSGIDYYEKTFKNK